MKKYKFDKKHIYKIIDLNQQLREETQLIKKTGSDLKHFHFMINKGDTNNNNICLWDNVWNASFNLEELIFLKNVLDKAIKIYQECLNDKVELKLEGITKRDLIDFYNGLQGGKASHALYKAIKNYIENEENDNE